VAVATLLSACATVPRGKPLLTEAAAHRILAVCHAEPGSLLRSKSQPPSIVITVPKAEQNGDAVAPTMTCVHDRLQAYRYGFIQIANSSPDGE
jgi:hypothetical protein